MEEEEAADDTEPLGPGVTRLMCEADATKLIDVPGCIAYASQIINLARTSVSKCNEDGCPTAGDVSIQQSFVGSAMYLRWVGHIYQLIPL